MKSESGITLISLITYIIAMVIVIAIITTLTGYFYNNVDSLQTRNEGSKQYTTFNSYFVKDINERENFVLSKFSNNTKIVFSNGNQYTYINGAIYYNKIKICKDITSCNFTYDNENNKVIAEIVISGKNYTNEYSIKKDV